MTGKELRQDNHYTLEKLAPSCWTHRLCQVYCNIVLLKEVGQKVPYFAKATINSQRNDSLTPELLACNEFEFLTGKA